MISLLLPSRGRPENLKRMADSAHETADGEIEIIVFIDDDEPKPKEYKAVEGVKLFTTPRTILSKYWNLAYEKAKGPIYMHCGDDLIFRTQGWDSIVKNKFEEYPDRIVFVHGDDGHPDRGRGVSFGTHGFLHRNWVETVGYFVPPHFSSDYNDTWLNDVSDKLGRKAFVNILTEHMHPDFQKGPLDQTHKERIERHWADNTPALYMNLENEREQDVQKLMKVING